MFDGYCCKRDGSPGPAETGLLLRSRGDIIIAVNGRPIVDEHFRPSYSFGEVLQPYVHAVSPPALKVHLTLVSALSEYDVYLQQVLWEDGDFVRAVEATHQQEKEEFEEVIVECAAPHVKKKKVKQAKLVISSLDDNIGALYIAPDIYQATFWTGLSFEVINKALEGDGLLSLRDGTDLYRIREAAHDENLAVGMTETGEMNWHYSVDVPATWSSDCTIEDVRDALALLFT